MKKALIIIFYIAIFSKAEAQKLAAYTDYRDRFYIFDDGKSVKVEDLDVQSYKVGGNCVMYINSLGNLKVYQNGLVSKLESGGASKYYATDYLAAYSIFEKLKVLRNGVPVTLSNRCTLYQVQDSLIVFYDKNQEMLKVYYDGTTTDIESGLVGNPINALASGDNIIAYISSRTKDFKIYYKGGNRTILQYVEGIKFKAGKDVVAYTNRLDNTFSVFYKGEIYPLENMPPESFGVGDGFVAYVDYMGAFKVFYNGEIIEASSFAPEAYLAEDNILVFNEHDYFKVFYKGEVFEVEGFIPPNFEIDWNTVAYLDNTYRLWLFTKGERRFLTNDMVKKFELNRDLIMLNVKVDRNIIYYNGVFYDGISN